MLKKSLFLPVLFAMFLGLLSLTSMTANSNNLKELRKLYPRAAESEPSARKMLEIAKNSASSAPVYLGYQGAATMIMANHAKYPLAKYQYFADGKDLLEKAIKKAPDQVELRYLRLTLQSNAPSFLGYNDQIASDKAFLLKKRNNIKDKDLLNIIDQYLKNTK